MAKSKPLICLFCQQEVEPEDYFNVRIRNYKSRIGHNQNVCRLCVGMPATDLPPSEDAYEKK